MFNFSNSLYDFIEIHCHMLSSKGERVQFAIIKKSRRGMVLEGAALLVTIKPRYIIRNTSILGQCLSSTRHERWTR